MASPVPAKSQPLHSFSLPQWKLRKNHHHHRGRKAADSSLQQLPPSDSAIRQSSLLDSSYRQSPMRDSASESEFSLANPVNRKKSAHIGGKNGSSDKQSSVLDIDKNKAKESRSKICFRLRSNSNSKPDEVHEEGQANVEEGQTNVEETLPKTWNLRPRKQSNSSLGRTSSPDNHNHNKSQSPKIAARRADMRSSEATETKGKKRKFSIPLSRDEIEEDLFAMTGSKPLRRPKKRSKTVQRQLDNVFPGLWLGSITSDLYKVSENSSKV